MASVTISGLTLSFVIYEEAIGMLRKRFDNKQLIVNRHMDLLLNLDPVTLQHDLKDFRKLYDVVESNVRGLEHWESSQAHTEVLFRLANCLLSYGSL